MTTVNTPECTHINAQIPDDSADESNLLTKPPMYTPADELGSSSS